MDEEILKNDPDKVSDDEKTAVKPDYEKEIIGIIGSSASPRKIRDSLSDYHENDIAEALPKLTLFERKKLYRILSTEELSNIFEFIDKDDIGAYLDEMDLKKAADLISNMESDEVVEVMREIEKDKRAVLAELLSEDVKKDIALIASFDEDEIGSRMTTNFIRISYDLTVKQAMSELIAQAPKNDNIYTIFVVDDGGYFYGAIDLKELIMARKDTDLEELIMTSFPYVYGNESIDDCIEQLKDYSENLIPVLDNNNRILGVITSQDIIEVVDDEMGEDYAKLAGLTAEEDLKEPLKDSMKKRLPWLIILLLLGMCVSSVVGIFESVVAQLTIIMSFQSLILSMAGNVGTQSLAVTIRVVMDESLTGRQKVKMVIKEMKVGLSNGLIVGAISFVIIGLYIVLLKGRTPSFAYAVSGCIGLSMVLAMVISGAMGTFVPLFFKKIKIDPAVASGPLITTMNDLVGVVAYYGLSWLLLIQMLHLGG